MNIQSIPKPDETIEVRIPEGASLNGHQNNLAHPVLEKLLGLIEPVDFREKMGLEEDEKPKQKHYVVMIIDEVLEVARNNRFGLAVQNDFIYIYDGVYWASLDRNEFKSFLGLAAQEMGLSVLEAKHYTFRHELFQQFLSAGNLPALFQQEIREATEGLGV